MVGTKSKGDDGCRSETPSQTLTRSCAVLREDTKVTSSTPLIFAGIRLALAMERAADWWRGIEREDGAEDWARTSSSGREPIEFLDLARGMLEVRESWMRASAPPPASGESRRQ